MGIAILGFGVVLYYFCSFIEFAVQLFVHLIKPEYKSPLIFERNQLNVCFLFSARAMRLYIYRELPLRRAPCRLQLSAILGILLGSLRSAWPIHPHFRFCIVLFIPGMPARCS